MKKTFNLILILLATVPLFGQAVLQESDLLGNWKAVSASVVHDVDEDKEIFIDFRKDKIKIDKGLAEALAVTDAEIEEALRAVFTPDKLFLDFLEGSRVKTGLFEEKIKIYIYEISVEEIESYKFTFFKIPNVIDDATIEIEEAELFFGFYDENSGFDIEIALEKVN